MSAPSPVSPALAAHREALALDLHRLISEHRPNVVTEEVGMPGGPRGARQWSTRIKCDSHSCGFYTEAPRYWDAVKVHDEHLRDVLLAYFADPAHGLTIEAGAVEYNPALHEGERDVLGSHLADWLEPHIGGRLSINRRDTFAVSILRFLLARGWVLPAHGLMVETGAVERLRDLTSRLGFGDGVTEPQADNDTIVGFFDEQGRDAAEWLEHQSWLNDCAAAGCDPLEDCSLHAPACHPAHGLTVETGAVEPDLTPWAVLRRVAQTMAHYPEAAAWVRMQADGWEEAHGLVRDEPSEDERPRCDTCRDTGRMPWMHESDPNCYQEPDDDGTVPCIDPAPGRSDDGRTAVEWSSGDRHDVAAWLIREADDRVKFFPQRRDGVDALLRHLAARLRHDDGEADRGE